MNVSSLRVRRTLTLAGAAAAVILGLAAIQAAAAWTASAAPLAVTPTSATSIETRLLEEQARPRTWGPGSRSPARPGSAAAPRPPRATAVDAMRTT
jgi:hypothetical protein